MCSYHVIVVCLLFQLILGEQFYFQHCENAIQTNHRKEPIIALWCRSNKKYKYCSVGNVIGNEQELSNSCKFQSTNYFSRNGPMFLKNMECDPKSFILDIWYEGIKQTDFDCIVQVNPSHNKDITNWFIEMESNDGNEKISKIFYAYLIRWSLSKVEQSKEQKGLCKNLKIQSAKDKEFVRFPNDPSGKENQISRYEHIFEYQFLYGKRPAYKHSLGNDIYLYWNKKGDDGEWVISTALSSRAMIRSACKEDFPQDCDDIWESENNKFRFNIVCVDDDLPIVSVAGSIYGIIIGVILVFILVTCIIVLLLFLWKRKRSDVPNLTTNITKTENDYDIAEITETKPEMEDQYVVVVSSIDLCEPKHKDTVLVQPVLNPYYGERTSDISGGNKNVSFVLE